MDSKNNIGHSADISFTAELPIPIYNGNNSMDFEKLASLYKDELLDSVLPFWLEHFSFTVQTAIVQEEFLVCIMR